MLSGVVFHNNNTQFVAAADKTVYVHQLSATRVVSLGAPIRALAVMPNGSHVLTAGDDKKVRLWHAKTGGAEPRVLEGSDQPLRAVAASRNNSLVAAGGDDRTVRVYNFDDGKLLLSLKTPGVVRDLAFSSDNRTLAAACDDKSIATWNIFYNPGQQPPPEFGKPQPTYSHAAAALALTFGRDNATIYSGGADKSIRAWKVTSSTPLKNFGHPNLVDAVAFNNTGTLLATGCHDGRLRIFDVAKGTQQKEINAHPGAGPARRPRRFTVSRGRRTASKFCLAAWIIP